MFSVAKLGQDVAAASIVFAPTLEHPLQRRSEKSSALLRYDVPEIQYPQGRELVYYRSKDDILHFSQISEV